jgi:site-specific recombinase XerD
MTSKEKAEFTAYLQARHIHGKTLTNYISRVNQYTQWLQSHAQKEPEQAEKKDILNYLQHLQENTQLAARTRRCALGMLYRYYAFLQKEQRILKNPAQLIKLRGTQKIILVKLFTIEEMQQLADAHYQLCVRPQGLQEQTQTQLRNHVALLLHIHQGINAQELNLLNVEALNLRKATISIPATRKANARTLPLHATQIGIFYEYVNNVLPVLHNPKNLLVNSVPKNLVSELKKIYPKFINFKQLRASLITYWIQTQGLRKAQYNAGHRYISSTENYLANDIESLKNDINKYHPIQTEQ